jgi:hypothetical protein
MALLFSELTAILIATKDLAQVFHGKLSVANFNMQIEQITWNVFFHYYSAFNTPFFTSTPLFSPPLCALCVLCGYFPHSLHALNV